MAKKIANKRTKKNVFKASKNITSSPVKKTRKLSVYSNLSKQPKSFAKKTDIAKEKRYIATLPKYSYKRLLFYFSPRHIASYWFSKKGAIKALKILGVMMVIFFLLVGGLFAYFRKDLDAIRPSELAKNVHSTVNTYLDRNGELLWEDKGAGNYKLVVDSKKIGDNIKQATVSIEDRDFYKHSGISISGLVRAAVNNFLGGRTQGGSTLTQQLIKQVFFSADSEKRGLNGIPRKIKEVILAIEVERMYDKDQILTLYLNESPYGGRRNGVESGAQTYFGKSSKDLTLPEAALIAAIPQNPSIYNPYNIPGHEGLIRRQHFVLDGMVKMKYITKKQSDEAKAYPIIDHINPESDQYKNIHAAHFVQMVRSQIEDELGSSVVGKGGLTIKTTLDIRIQNKLEEAMNDMFSSNAPSYAGFSNGASTVEDVKTGQIIAMLGSRDFSYPGFGQDNAAVSFIQPGSSIKPLVYSSLFTKKPVGQLNFGSGSILKDENIDSLYGATVRNADRKFNGDITIRSSLATSRNIPAIKAMYISGVKNTINNIHSLGATSYCTNGDEVNAGLAAAIGGCGIRQIDLVSGYSSIAREGVYKPQSTVLEIKNNNKKVLKKWVDPAGKQVVDPQSTYIVSDILTDSSARAPLSGYHAVGMDIDGVKTATKTGTSDKGGQAKDIWMASYSPALAMVVWLGNSDATILKAGTSSIPGPIIDKVMSYAHKEVYAPAGLWKTGDWFGQPAGIQRIEGEIYPSWWNKKQGRTEEKMVFDSLSKFKATEFTPEASKIELDVIKAIDPVTKKEIYIAPDGYDASKNDDKHLATDVMPSISLTLGGSKPEIVNAVDPNTRSIKITPVVNSNSTYPISNIDIFANGVLVKTMNNTESFNYTYTSTATDTKEKTIVFTAKVTDTGLYSSSTDANTQVSVTFPAQVPAQAPKITFP